MSGVSGENDEFAKPQHNVNLASKDVLEVDYAIEPRGEGGDKRGQMKFAFYSMPQSHSGDPVGTDWR